MYVLIDIAFLVVVLGIFVFGYHLMSQLDNHLDENRKHIEKENETKEPSYIVLSEEMSDEDILEEIRKFRDKHENTCVLLYDSSKTDVSV